ncbi:hypothetical protein GCM10009679_36800 [Saccharothrix algeriensis]|uniref:SCP domain-containing protein n=2 Tax=Catellatospora bangladeshensis TaxID=310355 RepID=A0A8J3JNA0_9ACTN|nr:hypothetical protein Cba03nite_51700 [Catellatospora bangladeshensis]
MWPALTASAALLSVLVGGVMAVGPALTAAPAGSGRAAPGGPVPDQPVPTLSVTVSGEPAGVPSTTPAPSPTAVTAPVGSAVPLPAPSRPAARRTTPPPAPLPAASSPPAHPSPRPTLESSRVTELEDQVTALINRERERAGCSRVRTDERMRTAARRHSADMAEHDYFSHTGRNGSSFVDRLAAAGYPRREAAGENIAYGYPTAQSVVDGWMASTGHRNNILDCDARATGVGLAYQGRTTYWTQEFGRD